MNLLNLCPGSIVGYQDQYWRLLATFSTDRGCIVSLDGRQKRLLALSELQPPITTTTEPCQMVLPLESSADRDAAEKWMECIRPFRSPADRSAKAIRDRAAEFGVHPATVYGRPV